MSPKWPRALAWMDEGIPLSPIVRLRIAWLMLVFAVAGMALSLLFVTGEPKLVLALSWGALGWTSVDTLMTADVRKQQEGE